MLNMLEENDGNCTLCERVIPIFVVGEDNVIMRLREKYLPPFLKRLKQAYMENERYLKYLRINSKLIRACNCEQQICHTYCITALMLMRKKIYCENCGQYYLLYLKSEKLINSELVENMLKQLFIYIVLGSAIYGVYLLDIYMKDKHDFSWSTLDSGQYELWILWAVLTIIMLWCTYIRFQVAFMKRQKIMWVEAQDCFTPEFPVTRN